VSALEQLALAGQALRLVLRRLLDVPLWAPWAALGALELALLGALVGFAHPLLSWLVAPLVAAAAGEPALHYPGFYAALPGLARGLGLMVAALPTALAAGWSTWLFAARWRGRRAAPGEAWAEAASRGGGLVLALLPFPLLAAGGALLIEHAVAGGSGTVRRLGDVSTLGVEVALRALGLFLPPLVMLEGRGAAAAWAALPRAWSRGLWAALALALPAALARLPLERQLEVAGADVAAGPPERVAWLAAARIGLGLVLSFVLAGGATVIHLGAVAVEEEG
jgi:hypothetical protein